MDVPPIPDLPAATWKSLISSSKDILPWLIMAANLTYGFGVKSSTSDRTLAQYQEDHASLELVKKDLVDLAKAQTGTDAKLNLVIQTFLNRGHDAK